MNPIDDIDAGLIALLIESDVGFVIKVDLLEIGRDKSRYYVCWDEYRNPHDNHCKCEIEFLWFKNPRTAAKCFMHLRRETLSGDDLYDGKSKRLWKDIAHRYLAYVKSEFPPHIVKHQRKIVGAAWAMAEAGNGYLDFNVG